MLTILNVAYPFARVGPDAVGGAEQIASLLDSALVAKGHRSIVIASEGSQIAGLHWPVPAEEGPLDDCARQRASAPPPARDRRGRRAFPVDLVHLHGIDFDAYCPRRVGRWLRCIFRWTGTRARRWPPTAQISLCMGSPTVQMRAAPADARFLPPIANGVDTKALAARHAETRFRVVPWTHLPREGRAPRHRCGETRRSPFDHCRPGLPLRGSRALLRRRDRAAARPLLPVPRVRSRSLASAASFRQRVAWSFRARPRKPVRSSPWRRWPAARRSSRSATARSPKSLRTGEPAISSIRRRDGRRHSRRASD